jgi:hypothetical protein|uniref:Uncharacterized protein n=1 Tax=viral metagenome TaxID=1070528 RepID=A0A6C0J092_9ZZZZ
MSTLYISTIKDVKTQDIALILAESGFECQISENISVIEDNENNYITELGFKIYFVDLEKKDFKEKVWIPLESTLDLKCAHIEYRNLFKGCIMNWPGIFAVNNCSLSENN